VPHLLTSLLAAALLAGALAAPRTAAAAELGVMPVSVQLDRLRDRATVQVINLGTEAVTLQADAVRWQREDGRDVDAPTADLILNPPIFTLPAGQTQVVRVGLKQANGTDQEVAYRLVMRELPPAPGERLLVNAQVRVLVSLRLPVYVAPMKVQRDERWTLQTDPQGQAVAEVSNRGNVHLKVATLRLQDGQRTLLAEQRPGALLFPGETRRFPLRAPMAGAGPLTLEVHGDQGVQHVASSNPGP
jgi:fimbrial chaperone protein